jgi:3-oxoadipate enol-lactonase
VERLQRGDVQLAYRWAGDSGGPLLLLSHSLGASGSMWEPQIRELGKRFRLLIPDHRGHGESSVPEQVYSIEDFGCDVLAMLDQLELQRVHFCGLSLGGMIGMWMARHAPERIDRLVLCNTAAKIMDTGLLQDRLRMIRQHGLEAIAESVIDRWFSAPFQSAHRDIVQASREMFLANSATGYINTSHAVCNLDLREDLASIACPTLVIAGRHDLATPVAWNAAIASAIAESEFKVLDAAHLSNIEAAGSFNQSVEDFLRVNRNG